MATDPKRPYKVQRRLKAAMALRGITTKDVAQEIGLTAGYVTLLLNGHAKPSPALEKINQFVRSRKPE